VRTYVFCCTVCVGTCLPVCSVDCACSPLATLSTKAVDFKRETQTPEDLQVGRSRSSSFSVVNVRLPRATPQGFAQRLKGSARKHLLSIADIELELRAKKRKQRERQLMLELMPRRRSGRVQVKQEEARLLRSVLASTVLHIRSTVVAGKTSSRPTACSRS